MDNQEKTPKKKEENEPYAKIALGVAFVAICLIFGIAVTFIASIWLLIPAAALIGSGIQDLSHQRKTAIPAPDNKERELLSAIRENGGSITPAEAALETSLTVREADEMLSELANGGHLQLDSRDGALYYSLPGRRTELET
ncbi:MAG: hypothetical protein ACFB50_06875 [Rubrobacteraceae bacterium]